MFDRGAFTNVALATRMGGASGGPEGVEPWPQACTWNRIMAGHTYRPARLIALLLAIVCISACQSTTGSELNVRALPTTASAVVDNLGSEGTPVVVECVVNGQAINGITTWYRISAPSTGYVTAYYVRMDENDTAPLC